jgi:3-oxoacyl-[acyl-carrier protein] reductase
VAVVTGGSRGIGAAIARRLARDGAKIVVVYNKQVEAAAGVVLEIKSAGGEAAAFGCDAGDLDAVGSMMQKAAGTFGRLDILINNAAMGGTAAPLGRITPDLYQRIFDVNVRGPMFIAQAAIGHMGERGGRIINISSMNWMVIGNIFPRHNVTYCVAKAGIVNLTRGMASEWAQYNIRVNALAPGFIHTQQTAASAKIPEIYERNLANTPMTRYGRIDELKGAIVFLASEASSFATGGVFNIDGGYTIW